MNIHKYKIYAIYVYTYIIYIYIRIVQRRLQVPMVFWSKQSLGHVTELECSEQSLALIESDQPLNFSTLFCHWKHQKCTQKMQIPGLHHADDTTALTTHASVPRISHIMGELGIWFSHRLSPTFARVTVRRRSPGHRSESEMWRRPPWPKGCPVEVSELVKTNWGFCRSKWYRNL